MQGNLKKYSLDFVIPQGPTGPQGMEGVTGPTGPASLSALIFTEFDASSQEGNLGIHNSTILPSNSNVFASQKSAIDINEAGSYEFIISGILEGLTLNEILSVSIIITSEDGNSYSVMLASILANTEQEYFSQTMLISFPKKQKIELLFRKNNNYSSTVKSVSLLIKKLNF